MRKTFFVLTAIIMIFGEMIFSEIIYNNLFSYSGAPAIHNIQLFDYNSDGVEEFVISYGRTDYWKVTIVDQSGTLLLSHIESKEAGQKFSTATIFSYESELYVAVSLSTSLNYSSEPTTSILRIYKLENFDLIAEYTFLMESDMWPGYYDVTDIEIQQTSVIEYNDECLVLLGSIVTYYKEGSDVAGIPYEDIDISHLDIYEFDDSLSYLERIDHAHALLLSNNVCYGLHALMSLDMENLLANIVLSGGLAGVIECLYNPTGIIIRYSINDENGKRYFLRCYSTDLDSIKWEVPYEVGLGFYCGAYLPSDKLNNLFVYYGERYINTQPYTIRKEVYIRNYDTGELVFSDTTADFKPEYIKIGSDNSTYVINYNNETHNWDVLSIEYSNPDNSINVVKESNNYYIDARNYPNPFNQSTNIRYSIPVTSNVQVSVYDISGNFIETIVDHIHLPSKYTVVWDASNISSGIYFYRVKTDNFCITKKMLLIK